MLSRPRSRPRNRRAGSGLALVATLTLTLAACGGGGDASAEPEEIDRDADLAGQTVVVSNWVDYMPDDIGEIVEAETGATVEVSNHATNEELVAKVTGSGGSGLDVVFGSQPFLQAFAEEGLLEPLDPQYLENWDSLDDRARDLAEVDGQPFFAPYTWGTTGICYRSDLVQQAPTSWNDLLDPDPAYQGQVTMMGTQRWAVLPAQKALGYSVNTTDEAEMDEVQALMTDAKPGLLAYDDSTFYERLVSGEAVMAEAWDGWCNYGTAENADIEFVVPEEGSDLWVDGMAILRSSEHKDAAYAFVDAVLDPENHAWAAENILYNVPSEQAMAQLPEELLTQFPTLGARREEMLQGENMVDVGEADALYSRVITEATSS